jgi:lactate dehydrogenase-like 2-hydroxyacid dehydrogenase
VVHNEALIDALRDGTLGAAAIDVIEGEPDVPPAMLMLPNLLITPHMASRTTDSLTCAYHLAADNLEAHFAGKRVPSLVTL